MLRLSQGIVILAEDDDAARGLYYHLLTSAGYSCAAFANGFDAMTFFRGHSDFVDAIVADIGMPGLSGLDCLRVARATKPDVTFILISGMYDEGRLLESVTGRATECLFKPFALDALLDAVIGRAEVRSAGPPPTADACMKYGPIRRLGQKTGNTVLPLLGLLGSRRIETLSHSLRVAALATLTGQVMSLGKEALGVLETGALLHDIGKIAVPLNILAKRGRLNPEERRIMQLHPEVGFRMIEPMSGMTTEGEVARCHHERFDGEGYPRRLRGNEIPINARIFSVVDTFDAMVSRRPYREPCTPHAARAEICAGAGSQFDTQVVEAFLSLTKTEIECATNEYTEITPAHPSRAWKQPPAFVEERVIA
jgi:response regulator RpfG family c-di-GMP phosphodiesterase